MDRKEVLIFSPTGIMSKQLGLTIEVLEVLKAEPSNRIKLVRCKGVLTNCYGNQVKNILACASCQSRMDHMLKSIGIDEDDQIVLQDIIDSTALSIPKFDTLDQLLNYDYNGINVGRGVASSIISYFRDYDFANYKRQELIELELKKAINVLLNFQEILNNYNFDELILFNGRFSEVHPVLELAKKLKLPFRTIEAGSALKYAFFDNALPHSIMARQEQMDKYWDKGDLIERENIGKAWFEDKRNRTSTLEKVYTDNQDNDRLPSNFNYSKRNIAIMNSSEDELKAIIEWRNSVYQHQNEAIVNIIQHYQYRDDIHFYLRVHPNLKDIDNTQTKVIREFDYPNLTVIGGEETIDSYGLIDACDYIIAFGSTAGIEATYWGNTSILFGKGFYSGMSCAYEPKSYHELYDIIDSSTILKPMPKENTYKYGYYWSVYGNEPKYFKFDGLKKSKYKDKVIKLFYSKMLLYVLKFIRYIRLWKTLHKEIYGQKLKFETMLRYK